MAHYASKVKQDARLDAGAMTLSNAGIALVAVYSLT